MAKRKLGGETISKNTISTDFIKSATARIQDDLKNACYDDAYRGAVELENRLRSIYLQNEGLKRIYLTTYIWKIRAKNGMHASIDEMETLCREYFDISKQNGDDARCAQAAMVYAQAAITQGKWQKAHASLERAKDIYYQAQMHYEYVQVLTDIAEIEAKQYHWDSALENLVHAENYSRQHLSSHDAYGMICHILMHMQEIYELRGDGHQCIENLSRIDEMMPIDDLYIIMNGGMSHIHALMQNDYDYDSATHQLHALARLLSERQDAPHIRTPWDQMIRFEDALLARKMGQYDHARQGFEQLSKESMPDTLRQACHIVRYQWAVETNARVAEQVRAELARESVDDWSFRSRSAVDMCSAELAIEQGHFEQAETLLTRIRDASDFLNLLPLTAAASSCLVPVYLSKNDIASAIHASEAAAHGYQTMLNRFESIQSLLTCFYLYEKYPSYPRCHFFDDDPLSSYDDEKKQLESISKSQFERCIQQGVDDDIMRLGLVMMRYFLICNNEKQLNAIKPILRPIIERSDMMHRQMVFSFLCSKCENNQENIQKAQDIANQYGYILPSI